MKVIAIVLLVALSASIFTLGIGETATQVASCEVVIDRYVVDKDTTLGKFTDGSAYSTLNSATTLNGILTSSRFIGEFGTEDGYYIPPLPHVKREVNHTYTEVVEGTLTIEFKDGSVLTYDRYKYPECMGNLGRDARVISVLGYNLGYEV